MKKLTFVMLILLANCIAVGGASAVINDGLMAYYPFNGNANDESGNGNNGTVSGAILTSDKFGNFHRAYKFDGIDDYISAESNGTLTPENEITITAWVNTSDVTFGRDGWQTIVSKGATYRSLYADYNLNLLTTGQGLQWESSTVGNSPKYVSVSYSLLSNTWYHVAATYSAGTVKLYINGILQITGTVANAALRSSAQPLYVGTRYLSAPNSEHMPFLGSIDEVHIYNRALSDEEINEIYEFMSSCSQSDLDAAYQKGVNAGKQACTTDPTSCGINTTGGSQCGTVTYDLFAPTVHYPCLNIGGTNYWLDLGIYSSSPTLLLNITNFGTH